MPNDCDKSKEYVDTFICISQSIFLSVLSFKQADNSAQDKEYYAVLNRELDGIKPRHQIKVITSQYYWLQDGSVSWKCKYSNFNPFRRPETHRPIKKRPSRTPLNHSSTADGQTVSHWSPRTTVWWLVNLNAHCVTPNGKRLGLNTAYPRNARNAESTSIHPLWLT